MASFQVTVEQAGQALLLRVPGVDEAAAAFAMALASERHRTAVVVAPSAAETLARLDPWLVADLDERVTGGIRLFHSRASVMPEVGSVPLARRLLDRLGVEVTAPDGDLVPLAGGHSFVAGTGAGWVTHGPGTDRRRSGPRFPEPWWQPHLPAAHAEQIALGLWVRAAGAPTRDHDPVRAMVPDPARPTLVAGAPGEPAPNPATVAEVLRSLPDAVRDRVALRCYGSDVSQQVADALGTAVRTVLGIPGPGHPVRIVAPSRPALSDVDSVTVVPHKAPAVVVTADGTLLPAPPPSAIQRTKAAPATVVPRSVVPRSVVPRSVVPQPPIRRPALESPAPVPPPPAASVAPDACSTQGDRRSVRASLGTRYDSATQAVVRLLAARPGLRSAADDHGTLLTELAVVRVFALDPDAAGYDTAFHTCLAAGLRRLPTMRGVVLCGGPAGADYREGSVLRLTSPMLAAATFGAAVPGRTEVLIWTVTGRRLEGLLDEPRRTDVVLPTHTALRVLAVDDQPAGPRRALLAEDGVPAERALASLRTAAAARVPSGTEMPAA